MSRDIPWEGALPISAGEEAVLRVAPFDESDLAQICTVENRAHEFGWKRAHFQSSLNTAHHHCVAVSTGGDYVAYAVVSLVAREAELLLLVVDKPWQGRGIGAAFLQYICTALIRQADNLFLEVRASNAVAIALYEKLDFHQIGLRHNYYRTDTGTEDACLYARTLGGFETW